MTIFIAGALLNRRRERIERRRVALSGIGAPPSQHPPLGLGGRSIELSLGLGHAPSVDAIILAADAFHEIARHLQATNDQDAIDQGRSDGAFLTQAAANVVIPARVRRHLTADVDSVANLP